MIILYAVFYQRQNGEVIIRLRSTLPTYAIGEKTSMGWKLLDIKRYYKGQYYNEKQYNDLVHHRNKKKQLLENFALVILNNKS